MWHKPSILAFTGLLTILPSLSAGVQEELHAIARHLINHPARVIEPQTASPSREYHLTLDINGTSVQIEFSDNNPDGNGPDGKPGNGDTIQIHSENTYFTDKNIDGIGSGEIAIGTGFPSGINRFRGSGEQQAITVLYQDLVHNIFTTITPKPVNPWFYKTDPSLVQKIRQFAAKIKNNPGAHTLFHTASTNPNAKPIGVTYSKTFHLADGREIQVGYDDHGDNGVDSTDTLWITVLPDSTYLTDHGLNGYGGRNHGVGDTSMGVPFVPTNNGLGHLVRPMEVDNHLERIINECH